jgi:hypothetical protein
LSTLSAVIQANPLLVTLGAAIFLGERSAGAAGSRSSWAFSASC